MASRSVNKVILVGNLGRDAETKFTPSGASVTKFAVATTRSWKDQSTNEWKEETNWTNVVVWRQENLANYLTKGKQVYVEGRLQTRSYDDKDGKKVYTTEVVADEVILLGGRGGDGRVGTGFWSAGGSSQHSRTRTWGRRRRTRRARRRPIRWIHGDHGRRRSLLSAPTVQTQPSASSGGASRSQNGTVNPNDVIPAQKLLRTIEQLCVASS